MDHDELVAGIFVGFMAGIFVGLVIFALSTTHWLSPKIINEQVFYYGRDYSEEGMDDSPQYWVVTKAKHTTGSISK